MAMPTGGERLSVPSWAVGIWVALAVAIAGAAISTSYNAGIMAKSVEQLSATVSRLEERMKSVESTIDANGNRITAIESRTSGDVRMPDLPVNQRNQYRTPRAR